MTRIVRFEDLSSFGIPFTRMHLRRMEAIGQFPKHLQLSPKRIGWMRREIEQWIEDKAAARDGTAA
jgi:predicted DNA-binding transcriptional regulator AlpA